MNALAEPLTPATDDMPVPLVFTDSAAAKVAVFAYDRETREPLWQSGIAQAGSSARDTWILGVGPLQYGNIYNGTRFAGKRIRNMAVKADESRLAEQTNGIDHRGNYLFANKFFDKKENAAEMAATPPPAPATTASPPPPNARISDAPSTTPSK